MWRERPPIEIIPEFAAVMIPRRHDVGRISRAVARYAIDMLPPVAPGAALSVRKVIAIDVLLAARHLRLLYFRFRFAKGRPLFGSSPNMMTALRA